MTPVLARSLALGLEAHIKGAYLGRACRPDPWTLGFEMPGGLTLGFCWEPATPCAGLCTWRWPRGAPEEILSRHAQGARVRGVRAVPGEPIVRVELAGEGARALVWEAIGRSANALLLGEGDLILWSGRLLKGPLRSGRTGEPWVQPPPWAGVIPKEAAECGEPSSYVVEEGPSLLMEGLLARGRRAAGAVLGQRAKTLARKIGAVEGERREGEVWSALEPLAQALMASGNLGRRGETERYVLDYTQDPPREESLPLDPAKTVLENAVALFKRVQKGRAREHATARVLAECRAELQALPAQREAVLACTDLSVLFPARGREGKRAAAGQFRRTLPPGVAAVPLPKGFAGYAGKNAQGNDTVSFKLGRGGDFWFHAEDYSGCHVVVRCPARLEELPYDVEQAAALYAAVHSGAPPGNRVAVVASRCKFLRRVPGALGRVMMGSHRTVFVDLPSPR